MAKSIAKYRPVLTAGQISHLLALAQTDYMSPEPVASTMSLSVITSLSPFIAKIQTAGIVPSYLAVQPSRADKTSSILADLGEAVAVANTSEIPATFAAKEDYWKYCYLKWSSDPTSCTMAELVAKDEYRYLHSLMSREEVAEHEAKVGS